MKGNIDVTILSETKPVQMIVRKNTIMMSMMTSMLKSLKKRYNYKKIVAFFFVLISHFVLKRTKMRVKYISQTVHVHVFLKHLKTLENVYHVHLAESMK